MRRATATLIFALMVSPVTAASADQPGRCYPPPCAVEALGAGGGADLAVTQAPRPSTADDLQSPTLFVATGLLGVLGSLTIVALRRRSHILRRAEGPLRSPAPPPMGGPASTPEPQPALR